MPIMDDIEEWFRAAYPDFLLNTKLDADKNALNCLAESEIISPSGEEIVIAQAKRPSTMQAFNASRAKAILKLRASDNYIIYQTTGELHPSI